MASYKTSLVSELKYVWDNYWQKNPQLRLIMCGSSPPFLIEEVMKSKALYNRSQHEFPVEEISIKSIGELVGTNRSEFESLDAYLPVGGIPIYLKKLGDESSVYLSLVQQSHKKGAYFLTRLSAFL